MAKTKNEQALRTEHDDNGQDNRALLKQLNDTGNEVVYKFSEIAFRVYESEEYKTWGYSSFPEYAEQELGLEYRTAMYRVAIGQAIAKNNIDHGKVAKLGWSKFAKLLPLMQKGKVTEKNLDKWLKVAETKTNKELEEYVAEQVTETVGGTHVVKTNVSLKFTPDQNKVWERAIKLAMEAAVTTNPNIGAEFIALSFLEHHDEGANEALRKHLTKLPEKAAAKPRKERADVGKKRNGKAPAKAEKAPAKSSKGKAAKKNAA